MTNIEEDGHAEFGDTKSTIVLRPCTPFGDATSASAQYYFGVALFKTGANQQALDRLNRALALNEQLYSVRLMLANVYIAEGDREAALDQLETYISEYPDSPQREPVERMKAELEQR